MKNRVLTMAALALGLAVFASGLSWARDPFVIFVNSKSSANKLPPIIDGKQIVNSTLSKLDYPTITVVAGVPVKWTINVPRANLSYCNNQIVISEYGIEYTFNAGDNVIEFTPTRAGQVPYSCWMGMIKSEITVVEAKAKSWWFG